MATRGPNGEIIPDHRSPEHWIEIDQRSNVLSAKQAAELISSARASGDPLLIEYVPMLVDAYCRLHKLGKHDESTQPAPTPSDRR